MIKQTGKILLAILLGQVIFNAAKAQVPEACSDYVNANGVHHLKIGRSMIYLPGNNWLYNHHSSIIEFKGKLVAIWSNGLINEDSPGQRIAFSVSYDFVHWSTLRVVATPGKAEKGTLRVLTAADLYKYKISWRLLRRV